MLIRKESKQDLGLDSKLVKVLWSLFIQAFPTPGFVRLVIRLSLHLSRAGSAPHMKTFLPAFGGKRRALPTAAVLPVNLVWNNLYTIVGYAGAAFPQSQHILILKRDTEEKMSSEDTKGHRHVITEVEIGVLELQVKEF